MCVANIKLNKRLCQIIILTQSLSILRNSLDSKEAKNLSVRLFKGILNGVVRHHFFLKHVSTGFG